MSATNTFKLDGEVVTFSDGDTIMDAAMRAGIYIPHLCHHPEFEPNGSCRVCTVSVNGRDRSACTFPAASGLEVESASDAIQSRRRALVQMLLSRATTSARGARRAVPANSRRLPITRVCWSPTLPSSSRDGQLTRRIPT